MLSVGSDPVPGGEFLWERKEVNLAGKCTTADESTDDAGGETPEPRLRIIKPGEENWNIKYPSRFISY